MTQRHRVHEWLRLKVRFGLSKVPYLPIRYTLAGAADEPTIMLWWSRVMPFLDPRRGPVTLFSRADNVCEESLKMHAYEPRSRHGGFFLHSSDGSEPDSGEHENPEGFIVRMRVPSHARPQKTAGARGRSGGGRSDRNDANRIDGMPAIRSGSVTGSRQRSHLPR